MNGRRWRWRGVIWRTIAAPVARGVIIGMIVRDGAAVVLVVDVLLAGSVDVVVAVGRGIASDEKCVLDPGEGRDACDAES